ncbi:phosphoinositide 3-phosphatase [Trichomonascus vanleenenianus]|uniref:phosphatidylinositol-3-phosphatase YMR1 n=1 Tax=Trichomonascus vanleenenianus TaxID=2268995 RepID=UPI003EC965A9
MEYIKVAKVPNVKLIRLGNASVGTLHLTTHHMIFREDTSSREIWVCYPIIAEVERRPFNPAVGHAVLKVRCRDFTYFALNFDADAVSKDVFDSVMKLTCVSSVDKLYAFMYKPGSAERRFNGWKFYDPRKEFERMGTFGADKWRFTEVNKNYTYSASYPALFVVPEAISDTTLNYASKFRSKSRVPALSYYHQFNSCTITRCSQPMVGLKQNRSPQDEKFVAAIFATTQVPDKVGASQENLIVDARPTANAVAQTAMGAGTEIMEYYKGAKKIYLGIENIHVMRDSLGKVIEALRVGDLSPLPPNQELLYRSSWLRHIALVLEGAVIVAEQIHYKFSHVLVHCSDGWDRTTQISSLAQIFLDPYYRTIDGFITLVEKDWLSFGHRFAERAGNLSSEKNFVQVNENNSQAQQVFNSVSHKLVKQQHIKYTAPIFHQFLDTVYQVVRQFPDKFEYNERFLRRLLYHNYSCQYGTFLYNCEREREEAGVKKRTRSVWDYFLARRVEFTNKGYVEPGELTAAETILLPDIEQVKWWPEIFGRKEEEMNQTLPLGALYSSAPLNERDDLRNIETSTSESQTPVPTDNEAIVEEKIFDQVREANRSAVSLTANTITTTEGPNASPYQDTVSAPVSSDLLPSFLQNRQPARSLSGKFDAMTLDTHDSKPNAPKSIFTKFSESTGLTEWLDK